MVRTAKKEIAPTTEEMLAQAMAPQAEQPYHLPENWCWTKVGAVCSFIGGGTPSKNHPEFWNGNIPWASVKDIKGDYLFETIDHITEAGLQSSVTNMSNENDLILVTRIEPAKTIISTIRASINQDLKIVKSDLPSAFLHYYFKTFQHVFEMKSSGSTVKGITVSNVENTPFPLPPLAEQQRIVNRIESLFVKLDEAKEKAQEVVDGFEARRAAILHKAFTGELTRKWVEQQGNAIKSWSIKRFYEVAEIKSNLVDPKDYQSYPHIAPDNIEKKTGRLLAYHTIKEDGVISGKHRFYSGQILYSKIRPNLSKAVLVDFDGLCSADMYPIESKAGVDTRYLWYYMLSEEFLLQATSAGSRSVLPKINQKELSQMCIRVTTEEEQRQIVTILDFLLEKEQRAKDAAEQVVNQIGTIKKSILARAYRGELGTNDPNDENAEELLKRVLQGKIVEQPVSSGRKKRRKSEDIQMTKTIMEVLSEQKQISPERLKAETSLDIDTFYAELKFLIESRTVVETRENLEVFLEVNHEDRQALD